MTGYSKASSASAISASDSLNTAIGKLEKALDGKGTSNLALGTTSTTAAAGNHTHSNYLTSISAATSSAIGGIKTGYTASTLSGDSYIAALELDANNKAYVKIPKAGITGALGLTPISSDSLSSYLPKTGGTISGGLEVKGNLTGSSYSIWSDGLVRGTMLYEGSSALSDIYAKKTSLDNYLTKSVASSTYQAKIGDGTNLQYLSTGETQIWRTYSGSDNEVALKLRSNHNDSLIHFANKDNKRLGYFGFIGGDLGYYKDVNGGLTTAKLWHSLNDGTGSGLDADKLDGQEGSYYASASSLGNYVNWNDTVTGGAISSLQDLYQIADDNTVFTTSGIEAVVDGLTAYMNDNYQAKGSYLTGITKSMVTTALGYTPPTTDTNTWRGVQDNLTSTATDQSLSANQGRVLNTNKLDKSGGTMTGPLVYSNASGNNKTSNYISAGGGYSTGSGKEGLKVLAIEQGDATMGLGVDLTGGPYELTVATARVSNSQSSKIVFATHTTGGTAYKTLGTFSASGAESPVVTFNVNGTIQENGTALSSKYLGINAKASSATVADSANAVAWGNVSGKPSSYYTLPTASSSTLGGVKVGSNITVSSGGIISLNSLNITNALGYTPLQPGSNFGNIECDDLQLAGTIYAANGDDYVHQYFTKTNITNALGYTPTPASHTHDYLPLSGGTLTSLLTLTHDKAQLQFRGGHTSYDAVVSYQTSGNEALLFTTKNAVTSFMFVNGEDTINNITSSRWTLLTPGIQIKNNKVSISKLIPNGTTPTYNLDVGGTANATTLYEDGTSLSNKYQAKLTSGTNIKTINGTSLLGSGNISISGGSGDTGTISKIWTGEASLTSSTINSQLWNTTRTALLLVYLESEDAHGYLFKRDIWQGEWAFTGTARQPGGENLLIDAEYQDGNGEWYSNVCNPSDITVYAIYDFK